MYKHLCVNLCLTEPHPLQDSKRSRENQKCRNLSAEITRTVVMQMEMCVFVEHRVHFAHVVIEQFCGFYHRWWNDFFLKTARKFWQVYWNLVWEKTQIKRGKALADLTDMTGNHVPGWSLVESAALQEAFSFGLIKNEWGLIDSNSLAHCEDWRQPPWKHRIWCCGEVH